MWTNLNCVIRLLLSHAVKQLLDRNSNLGENWTWQNLKWLLCKEYMEIMPFQKSSCLESSLHHSELLITHSRISSSHYHNYWLQIHSQGSGRTVNLVTGVVYIINSVTGYAVLLILTDFVISDNTNSKKGTRKLLFKKM